MKKYQNFFQFECNNENNNTTSSVLETGASNLECMTTPWVRLFSRYTVQNFVDMKFFCHSDFDVTINSFFTANDRNLLVGNPHEFPFSESPLCFEIHNRYLCGSLLCVECLDTPS